jgi:uncharacterized UBP type Zn finger protein
MCYLKKIIITQLNFLTCQCTLVTGRHNKRNKLSAIFFFFYQDQIQQLRDMGITDEALARRALQATGGDLQAALDLIFGDGHF